MANKNKLSIYLIKSGITSVNDIFDSPDKIRETKPDYILITPWNIKDEIIKQLEYTRNWNCRFIVGIPQAEVI